MIRYLLASFTIATALALALHVLVRARRTPLCLVLAGASLGITLWTAGAMLRWGAGDTNELRAAVDLLFTGIIVAATSWLLLSGMMAGARFAKHPRWLVAFGIPPGLLFLGMATNDGHGLFIRNLSLEAFESGATAFAGPLYWATLAWIYSCIGIATWLQLSQARKHRDRTLRVLMAGAAVVPVGSSLLYVAQWIPISFDPTPMVLGASMVVLHVATFRFQLLSRVPLAHRMVVDELDDGVVMADLSGRIVDCNPAAQRFLERRHHELRGKMLKEALEPVRDATTQTAASRSIEINEGDVRHVSGRAIGHFALLMDRTEERHAEQLARRAQRLETVGAMAVGIAHEINDPLAFARSNLRRVAELADRIAAREFDLEKGLAEELDDIHPIAYETLDGIERISNIVAGMQGLTTKTDGDHNLVDLVEVASDALKMLRIDEASGRIETSFAPGGVWVRGSATRLSQVVLNLIVNARDAAGRDGTVRIDVHNGVDRATLAVEDDGPGVPPDLAERIFDPFFTTKGPDAGTGLGLAIACDIAREHGGELEERGASGKGARFVLRLPQATPLADADDDEHRVGS